MVEYSFLQPLTHYLVICAIINSYLKHSLSFDLVESYNIPVYRQVSIGHCILCIIRYFMRHEVNWRLKGPP